MEIINYLLIFQIPLCLYIIVIGKIDNINGIFFTYCVRLIPNEHEKDLATVAFFIGFILKLSSLSLLHFVWCRK